MHRIIEVLSEAIVHPYMRFVFPTEIACSRWIDRLLQYSGCGTLALESFMTWDTFKTEVVRSRRRDTEPIPPVLRKLFVSRLLEENAARVKTGDKPWFSSLVPVEYAYMAGSLSSWFTAMLPQLGAWFEKKTGIPLARCTDAGNHFEGSDSTDQDLYTLLLRYREFLAAHGCFEPAWETPSFDTIDTPGMHYHIFFPEILPDWTDFQEALETSEQVTLIPVPAAIPKQAQTFFYTNARSEITAAALFIRNLVEHHGIPWESIAVSIPDREHYEPYLLREFTNRNIPVVLHGGKPVVSYPGGQLFPAIETCVSRGFAFDAMANLLLNTQLPWKDPEAIGQLIAFGITHNCICSWKEREEADHTVMDVWEDAFAAVSGRREERAHAWYRTLKADLHGLYTAPSFGEVLRRYGIFREHCLDCSDREPGHSETQALLGRCLSELRDLVALEKAFPEVKISRPFAFFVEHLKETSYQARKTGSGVPVLPYRIAAAAPFDWHIVIGATQGDLTTVFSRFGFLPAVQRNQLGVCDRDVSGAYIDLYTLNGLQGTAFFCAQQTFSGYALPHSLLSAAAKPRIRYEETADERFAQDLFQAEQDSYQAPDRAAAGFPRYLHGSQQAGFAAWRSRRSLPEQGDSGETMRSPRLQEVIAERYGQEGSGVLRVSASALEPYYQCALHWLFADVLGLERVRMETTLMAENVLGTVYHRVLDCFFKGVKAQGGVLAQEVPGKFPEAYRILLEQSLTRVFSDLSPGSGIFQGFTLSALTIRLLQAQRRVIQEQIERFLTSFLRYFRGFRVLESEKKLTYHQPGDPYLLTGTIDCLLEDFRDDADTMVSAGTGVIVDFKLVHTPSRSACIGRGTSGLEHFQLPLYLILAEKNGSPPIHRALFFSILHAKPEVVLGVIQDQSVPNGNEGKGGKKIPYRQGDRIERTDAPDDPFHRILEECEQKVRRYASDALSGEFSTYSASEKKCYSCTWHTLCRTGYAVAGTRFPIGGGS
ncbi:MAG: PD-(D/E)XK nuclease family protein [Treponema sp.]|jgi:hypothetical protein|nr:PD-(D/E)XK nuclease family protein [Treponema sp.]